MGHNHLEYEEGSAAVKLKEKNLHISTRTLRFATGRFSSISHILADKKINTNVAF